MIIPFVFTNENLAWTPRFLVLDLPPVVGWVDGLGHLGCDREMNG